MGLLESLGSGLSYAGDVEAKFGGRAIRGALAGKPRELLSPIPFSDTLGITDPHQATSGSELASKLGISHPLGNTAAGFGIDIATDPLSYLGGLGAAKAASGVPKAADAASAFSRTKGLREAIPFIKDLRGPGERIVGGSPELWGGESRLKGMAGIHEALKTQSTPGAKFQGATFSPWTDKPLAGSGYTAAGVGPDVAMHELYGHGIPQAAALAGQADLLRGQPLAYGAAKLHQLGGFKDTGLAEGLANALEETHAHGIEARKGPGGYTKGAADFLFSPSKHSIYDAQIRARSPLAATAFHASPGAILGGTAGAAGGAAGGYEEGGVPGGFAGAALGGLGGAALGGGLSAWRMAPKRAPWKADIPSDLIKELADMDRAKHGGSASSIFGGSKLLKQYDRVAPALEVRNSPVNRFQRLSDAAGVKFKLPKTEQDVMDLIGSKDLSRTLAAYDPALNWVVPNIKHFPGLWSDTETMNQALKNFGPQFSTNLSDQLALHEITHALHHAQNTGEIMWRGQLQPYNNPHFFQNLNTSAKAENFETGTSLWDKYKDLVPRNVSSYGATMPTEFVAERNPQRIMAHIADKPVGSPELSRLYKELKGPKNPHPLLDELDRMYGGDINRAIRGESSSVSPGAHAVPPNPIDLQARKALEGANWEMASGAPERFSTDPARKAYYAKERQLRYAQRMGAPQSLIEKLRAGLRAGGGAMAGPLLESLFGSPSEDYGLQGSN